MKMIKKKGFYYVLMIIAAVLSVCTVILGATQKAMTLNTNFSLPLTVTLIAGFAVVIIHAFVDVDFLPLLTSILFSTSFGMIINEGLPVVVDKINDISFQGGKFPQVAAYISMMLVACLLSFVACFAKKKES